MIETIITIFALGFLGIALAIGGDPHQFVGTYEGFVVCLESILEENKHD